MYKTAKNAQNHRCLQHYFAGISKWIQKKQKKEGKSNNLANIYHEIQEKNMSLFLPEDWIEEVRSRNDIVDVISEYLPLKPSGRGYFGLCPFHNEKTASFHVNPELQIYKCFGCGEGGNVFSFIRSIERIDFVEAVKLLAERVGMPLPNTVDEDKFIKSKNLRDKLYDLNREAARYFHEMLFSEEGAHALDYLYSRGLSLQTIRSFGLGYAPEGWENTKKHLMDKGFDEQILKEAGIVVENKGRSYDRFRNRIIFPIIHPRGMVVGFGGRVLDDSLPKYLNSSDSPVFNKSQTLFGLNLVNKQRPLDSVIIVEGYMDVITMHQFGFKNVAASLGTSLTQEQGKLLRRCAGDVYIAYDGDTAGQKAALRGLDILQDAGCKVKVLCFPKEMDPDQILHKYGPEYLRKIINEALPLVDYKLSQLEKQFDLDTQEGKVAYATAAAQILIKVDNLLERDAHIQRLENVTGFKSRLFYHEIERLEGKQTPKGVNRNRFGNNRNTSGVRINHLLLPGHIKAERYLINLMVQNIENAKAIMAGMGDHTFEEDASREVLQIVSRLIQNGKEINPAQILNYIEDQDKVQHLVEIFEMEIAYDNIDKLIADCLDEIIRNNLERQRQELKLKISQMDQNSSIDPDQYRLLLKKLETLNRKVRMGRHERRERYEKRRVQDESY